MLITSPRSNYSTSNSIFLNSASPNYDFSASFPSTPPQTYESELSQTRKAETRRRLAAERRHELLVEVTAMEVKMQIERRWQPNDPQYIETVKYMSERKYHRALKHLQKLVIQRLFELNRLNLAGTGRLYCNLCTTVSNWLIGYRMRTHIAKSLNTRCKAIQNAVKSYNAVALHMSPPRPTLDWEKASHYAFLEDFQLLYNTRQDIRHKQWSDPVVRVAMKQKQRIDRAREEIENCNVEILRLHTHLLDETFALQEIAQELTAQNHMIAGAVNDFVTRRSRVNQYLLACVTDIHAMKGYGGSKTPGVMAGAAGKVSTAQLVAAIAQEKDATPDHQDLHAGDELNEDDEAIGEYGGLVDFVAELPVKK